MIIIFTVWLLLTSPVFLSAFGVLELSLVFVMPSLLSVSYIFLLHTPYPHLQVLTLQVSGWILSFGNLSLTFKSELGALHSSAALYLPCNCCFVHHVP